VRSRDRLRGHPRTRPPRRGSSVRVGLWASGSPRAPLGHVYPQRSPNQLSVGRVDITVRMSQSTSVSVSGTTDTRKPRKQRLDQAMVERGLASGRDRARALVMAREVMVDGQVAHRPAASVTEDTLIEVKASPPFVSRG